MGIDPREALSLIGLLVSMFGGKRRKKLALEIFPQLSSILEQWPGVELRLREVAANDPVLSKFRESVEDVYRKARTIG